jgi:hypothetical protein
LNYSKNNTYGSKLISYLLASLFHLILIAAFYLTNYEEKALTEKRTITLQFQSISKAPKPEDQRVIKRKKESGKSISPQTSVEKDTEIFVDTTNILSELDTAKTLETEPDSAEILDSFIEENPNIVALKTAILQKLKNVEFTETDSAAIAKNLRKIFLAYYKTLYPTPLSKFGRPSLPGENRPDMLNFSIPIDEIINLFK